MTWETLKECEICKTPFLCNCTRQKYCSSRCKKVASRRCPSYSKWRMKINDAWAKKKIDRQLAISNAVIAREKLKQKILAKFRPK